MKCKLCSNIFNKYNQQGGYIKNEWFCNKHIDNQPESSKREDLVEEPSCCGRPMSAVFGKRDGYFCDNCGNWKPRCGTPNPMET
jgi:hypothetical protein